MDLFRVSEKNISMVVFINLLPELVKLAKEIDDQIYQALDDMTLPGVLYKPFCGNRHITLTGMEVVKFMGVLYNANFLTANGQLRTIDYRGLMDFLDAVTGSSKLLFRIRFGGFPVAFCKCTGVELLDWKCTSSRSEFHTYGRSTYEGSFYITRSGNVMMTGWPVIEAGDTDEFPHTLYIFRRILENFGLLDKYHSDQRPDWKDDDCYLKLGKFETLSASESLDIIVSKIRNFLSLRKPVKVNIKIDDLSIVLYHDTALELLEEKVLVIDAIKDTDRVRSLYDKLSHFI